MLERIRLTIINNLLKYHPVSMLTILKICPCLYFFVGINLDFQFYQILLLCMRLIYLIQP